MQPPPSMPRTHHPMLKLYPFNNSFLFSLSLSSVNFYSTVFMILTIPGTLYKWTHTIFAFRIWLILLDMTFPRLIHVAVCVRIFFPSFVLLHSSSSLLLLCLWYWELNPGHITTEPHPPSFLFFISDRVSLSCLRSCQIA